MTAGNAQRPRRADASQRSRQGTRPITVHMPTDVRDQLKILAIKLGMPMNRLIVEFFNDGFAKHGLPQIARLKDED